MISVEFKSGCEESDGILRSCQRRNMGNEESGYGNSENRILCCICLSVFRKVCIAAQLIAASCTGKWSRYHMLKIFYFPSSNQLLNVSYLFCPGQMSPLIIILEYSTIALPKKMVQGSRWCQCIFKENV